MNRYHFAILFCAFAIVLFTITDIQSSTVFNKREAENQLKDTIHFAVSSAINTLSREYGSADDCYAMSDNFFSALSIMKNDECVALGRVLPEDFYPHVPVMIYLEERYYNLGYFDGDSYCWEKELFYTADHKPLSKIPKEQLLILLEEQMELYLNKYKTAINMPDVNFVLPDYIMRNIDAGTFVTALESFPTILRKYYYSGTYVETANIKPR